MAKPDCEDGWMMLAHELFAALAYAGFTKWEWVVIREVLSQVYGPKRTRTAKVSPSELGGRLGTFKESISRATRSLVASGVLVKVGEGEYRFVKDYERWATGGAPRLTAAEAGDCRKAKTRVTSTESVNNGAHTSTSVVNNGAHGVSACAHGPLTDALTNVSAGAHESAPPLRTPLVGVEEKKEREKRTHARSLDEMTTGRTGDEHRLFVQVVSELESHEPTEFLAGALVMAADSPGIRMLPSWRLLVAARTVQRPDKSKTWGLFQRVAETCTKADYDKVSRPLVDGSPSQARPASPTTNQPASGMNPPEDLKLYADVSADLMAKHRANKLAAIRGKPA